VKHETNGESLTLIQAVLAVTVAWFCCATAQAQTVSVSDTDALARFAPEFADSELGFHLNELQQRLAASRTVEAGYRLVKDLNGDGRPELVLLGHGTKNGYSQSFVLILTQQADGTWAHSKTLTFNQPYLLAEDSRKGVNIYFCEACDAGGRVTWNGSDYQFDPFSPGPPPTPSKTPSK